MLSESAEEEETRLFVVLVDVDEDVIDCGEGIITPVDENDDTNPTRVLLKSNIPGGCNNCNINIVAAGDRRSIVVVHRRPSSSSSVVVRRTDRWAFER